jgi:hypothetical protein
MSSRGDARRSKVFCIGRNKTGTKSLGQALKDLGHKVGHPSEGALLMDDWARRDFRRIVAHCTTADAFHDVPFSLPYTFQILDFAFPGSRFILTIRNSPDEWYDSYIRFHGRIMGVTGKPTADDLKNCVLWGKGELWRQQQNVFGIDESTLYDETLYKAHYTSHNLQVMDYFRHRPGDLLVLNLTEPAAMESLCRFLGFQYTGQIMPHLNKTAG